jgi:outer membrane protein TolC
MTRRRFPAALAALATLAAALPAAAETAAAPLRLTVAEAVLLGLEGNRALAVQRAAPAIAATGEEAALAPFDTTLEAGASLSSERSPDGAGGAATRTGGKVGAGARRVLQSGTELAGSLESSVTADPSSAATRLGASVTQPLLRDRGAAANLASVRQARLDVDLSRHELRGFAESLVAAVEQACWDYHLAGRRVEIVERSLRLAEDQLAEVRERIAVGRLAEIEQVAAEAEVALRHEALINARSALATARLDLLRLVNPPGERPLDRDVAITDPPLLPAAEAEPLADLVAGALARRPDLAQARLQLERGDLELVKTRNGLLPRLDLFVALGKTGYADSFGGSLDLDGPGHDLAAGLTLTFALDNRAARAAERRATLLRGQAAEALANLEQLAEVDVRTAAIETARQREQVAATAVALRLQGEKLRAETEKFRVGASTAFLVAQAQRDLLAAETDAEGAVVGLLKALVDLRRLDGSLLERRGIGTFE